MMVPSCGHTERTYGCRACDALVMIGRMVMQRQVEALTVTLSFVFMALEIRKNFWKDSNLS